MWSLWCTSSCSSCSSSHPIKKTSPLAASSDSPFFLHQLLAAGTVQFKFRADCSGGTPCNHEPTDDRWHELDIYRLRPHLDIGENSEALAATLCQSLEFLIQRQIIQATYLEFDNIATVRIYLVPEELKNSHFQNLNALPLPKKHLQNLLSSISRSHYSWDGIGASSKEDPLIPLPEGDLTLADIYTDLSSPTPQGFDEISCRLLSYNDSLADLGFRTKLYKYQRRSIASMVEKELDTSAVLNPLFIPMPALGSLASSPTMWYFQPGTFSVLRDCPKIMPCRGGILCEELGTGKTIITLGLIVATLNQLSSPEASIADARDVLTPFSFRHSPSKECIAARAKTKLHELENNPTPTRFPTLVELLVDVWRKNPPSLSPKKGTKPQNRDALIQSLPFKNDMNAIIQANVPFYHHYLTDPIARSSGATGFKKMYLTSATLIVVPDILIGQWLGEIKKHLDIPLRICVLESKHTSTPTAHQLATSYDIVLMTLGRFSSEVKYAGKGRTDSQLYNSVPCKCPEFSETIRVPQCTDSCQTRVNVSPFLQIRWKRLVFDEGNIAHADNSERVSFAMRLSVERRWIISGTPTTNLRGVKFGTTPGNMSSETGDRLQMDLDDHSTIPTPTQRIWTNDDREDLRKLGKMITGFLAAPRFKDDPRLKDLTRELIEPVMDCRGPGLGSIQILKQLMQSFMIRHRVEDVEREVLLEPCKKEVVLLDLEPYAARSFNALQAGLVINAVDSGRQGSDYMFDKKNEKSLNITVKNMWQLLFWRADEDKYNAGETLNSAKYFRENITSRGASKEDEEALEEALSHLEAAWKDTTWKEIQMNIDMPFRVSHVDKDVLDSWSRIYDYSGTGNHFMHLDQLKGLRDTIMRRPLIRKNKLIQKADNWGLSLASLEPTQSVLLAQSRFAKMRVGSSGSSKLNYILGEVLRYSGTEKFLIFSDANITPLSLDYVADGLDLVQIKFLHLKTAVPLQDREKMVTAFETSEEYRAFLVDLRAAARGLNLVSASRIIFCEPVWEADLEIQAIKRAHRIGQTRPVTVKTLAIRGTAEENMIIHIANRNTQAKIPAHVQDEPGMKAFIANPKFINVPPINLPQIDFPLFRIPDHTSTLLSSPSRSPNIHIDSQGTILQQVVSPPPKKRKKTVDFTTH